MIASIASPIEPALSPVIKTKRGFYKNAPIPLLKSQMAEVLHLLHKYEIHCHTQLRNMLTCMIMNS